MTIIEIPYNFNPRPYQKAVWRALDSGIARVLLRWHRRAGKDKFCWCYMISQAAKTSGNYFYVFPEAAQGRKALWEDIDKDGFSAIDHIPKELNANINSQEMRVTISRTMDGGKSIIRIIGLDNNKDSIRGVSCRGAVFSEFAYQDPDAYKVLMPSIREKDGWVIWNSTPQGMNHFYDLEDANKDNDNWHISTLQTYWPDRENYSGLIPPDKLKEVQMEDGLSDEDAEREYGVSYGTGTKGSIYGDFILKAREEGRIGSYGYDSNYPVHTLWDLGYNDPTAVIFVQYIQGETRFIDYWEEAKMDIPEIVRTVIYEKGYNYVAHHLPHDAEQNYGLGITKRELLEKSLRAFNLKDHVLVGEKQPIKLGIEAVQGRFSSYYFNATLCSEFLDKLALYHNKWDSRRKIFIKEPVHDYTSHGADALRLEPLSSYSWSAPYRPPEQTGSLNFDVFDY